MTRTATMSMVELASARWISYNRLSMKSSTVPILRMLALPLRGKLMENPPQSRRIMDRMMENPGRARRMKNQSREVGNPARCRGMGWSITPVGHRQSRSDYLNVLPNHRDRGGFPNPVIDEHFRDRRNNIFNAGQMFKFTFLRFPWFLDSDNAPPFSAPVPPPDCPTPRRKKFAYLLMEQVGIISDRVCHQRTKTKLKRRGGLKAFIRAYEKSGVYAGFSIVDQHGCRVKRAQRGRHRWRFQSDCP